MFGSHIASAGCALPSSSSPPLLTGRPSPWSSCTARDGVSRQGRGVGLLRRFASVVAVVLGSAAPAVAGDLALPAEVARPPLLSPKPVSQWEVEFGARY